MRPVSPLRRTFCLALLMAAALGPLQGCVADPAQSAFEGAERSLGRGDYKDALEKYSSVAESFQGSPYGPRSQYKVAVIWGRIGDGKKAEEAYRRLIYLYPETPEAEASRVELAAFYSRGGEHGKALEELQKLLKERPADRARFHYLIAMEYVKMNDFRQARIEFRELLKHVSNPGLIPRVNYQIANTYYMEGDIEEAVSGYDRIISEDPGNDVAIEARFSKAKVLDEAGRLREALAILKGLEGVYPNRQALSTRIAWLEERLRSGEE